MAQAPVRFTRLPSSSVLKDCLITGNANNLQAPVSDPARFQVAVTNVPDRRFREGIRPKGFSRFGPLNRFVQSRTRNSGAKADRAPNASRSTEVLGGRDSVWSARVFSTAFGPRVLQSAPRNDSRLAPLNRRDARATTGFLRC